MKNPQRKTRQRAALTAALREVEAFRSAQELHDELGSRGHSIGLTTVYRNLQALSEEGEVDVLRREDGEAIFRLCHTAEHHHHLVCRNCGHTVEIDNARVEEWAEAVGRAHGFRELSHDVEIFGLCPNCS